MSHKSAEVHQRASTQNKPGASRFSRRTIVTGTLIGAGCFVGAGIWSLSAGKPVSSSAPRPSTSSGHVLLSWNNWASALAWSPDSTYIASASDDVQIFEARTGATVFTYTGQRHGVALVAWSPDGKRIASADGESTIQVWSPD
jgi:WD40 repeat protein